MQMNDMKSIFSSLRLVLCTPFTTSATTHYSARLGKHCWFQGSLVAVISWLEPQAHPHSLWAFVDLNLSNCAIYELSFIGPLLNMVREGHDESLERYCRYVDPLKLP